MPHFYFFSKLEYNGDIIHVRASNEFILLIWIEAQIRIPTNFHKAAHNHEYNEFYSNRKREKNHHNYGMENNVKRFYNKGSKKYFYKFHHHQHRQHITKSANLEKNKYLGLSCSS